MLRYNTNYKINPGDDLGDPNFWNPKWQDVDVRLNGLEGQFGKFDAASAQIIAAGISRINDTFQPLLDSLSGQVNTLSATVISLNQQITDQQAGVVTQLNDLLAQAQALVTELEGTGVFDGGTF